MLTVFEVDAQYQLFWISLVSSNSWPPSWFHSYEIHNFILIPTLWASGGLRSNSFHFINLLMAEGSVFFQPKH